MTDTARISVFTFESTHHALWAEDVAREEGVPVEVISAPPESGSKCDLALRVPGERVSDLEASFDSEGIEYRVWRPEAEGG
ncbi:MAG: DUF3343 domain-containing protein [Gemmatimonadales bacterium]|nr:MAG: DUF3343 domain-containing protein [Gemmatimonadales bacterium]